MREGRDPHPKEPVNNCRAIKLEKSPCRQITEFAPTYLLSKSPKHSFGFEAPNLIAQQNAGTGLP